VKALLLTVIALAGANAASAQVTFELLETPGKSQWADFSLSRDGRSMGCVVGGAVYWWTTGDGYRYLDTGTDAGGGVGMAPDGTALIAARATTDGAVPTVWYADGSSVNLGSLVRGCDGDHPADCGFDLSADGSVAVGQVATCDANVGFIWNRSGGIRRIGEPAPGDSRSTAVSADGSLVVGYCDHPDNGYHQPALWRDEVGPELFLGEHMAGEALGISLNGRHVVGQAELGGVSPQGFYWSPGQSPVGLGSVSGQAADVSVARAVSNDGKVIGWSGDALWGNQEAFIWTATGGMRSLADLLRENDVELPAGMVLTAALDISGDGTTVVGVCRDHNWNEGYWRIGLGDAVESTSPPPAPPRRLQDAAHVAPDTIEVYGADLLNPFPFGKRRYDQAP